MGHCQRPLLESIQASRRRFNIILPLSATASNKTQPFIQAVNIKAQASLRPVLCAGLAHRCYGQKGQGGQTFFPLTSVVLAAGRHSAPHSGVQPGGQVGSSQQHEVLAAFLAVAASDSVHGLHQADSVYYRRFIYRTEAQMKKTSSNTHRIDLMFRAFSDRTRLRILSILQEGETCVGDLVDILGIEQPSASRHLAYLRRAGLVGVRRAGLWCYYSLVPAQAAFHQKLLECLACCFQEVPQIKADKRQTRKVRIVGGCCPGTSRNSAAEPTTQKPDPCCALPHS